MSTPSPELRTGLPTGAGGPKGSDNSGTWSLAEQEAEFAATTAPAPPAPAPKPAASKTSSSGSS